MSTRIRPSPNAIAYFFTPFDVELLGLQRGMDCAAMRVRAVDAQTETDWRQPLDETIYVGNYLYVFAFARLLSQSMIFWDHSTQN